MRLHIDIFARVTGIIVILALACKDTPDEAAARKLIEEAAAARQRSDEAAAAKDKAEQIARQAVEEARKAQEQIDQLDRDMKEHNDQLAKADAAVKAAQNDADRKQAMEALAKLIQQKTELEARVAAAKAAALKAERAKGVHISKECLENPLAKGCS